MTPALSREERDAMRSRATNATKGDDPSYYAGAFVADRPIGFSRHEEGK